MWVMYLFAWKSTWVQAPQLVFCFFFFINIELVLVFSFYIIELISLIQNRYFILFGILGLSVNILPFLLNCYYYNSYILDYYLIYSYLHYILYHTNFKWFPSYFQIDWILVLDTKDVIYVFCIHSKRVSMYIPLCI
jgi:hypothetical protein